MTAAGLFSVTGRVVCVTGASSGLGRGLATALSEAGARVVGVARREDALEELLAETDGDTAALVADLSDPASMAKVATRIAEPFGAPEILINAAGSTPARRPTT